MAQKQLSPQTAQLVADFARTHPTYDFSSGLGGVIGSVRGSDPQAARDFLPVMQALKQEGFHFDSQGTPQQNMAAWKQALLGAAVVLGPLAIPLGGAATSGAVSAGAGAGTSAGGAAAAGAAGSSLWKTLLPVGTNILGAGLQYRSNSQALKSEDTARERELAFQKELFDKQREDELRREAIDQSRYGDSRKDIERNYADLGPYRDIGRGSLNALSMGTGLSGGAPQAQPAPMQGGGSLSQMAAPQASQAPPASMGVPVHMRAPDGQVYAVPPNQVASAEQQGGVRV